MKLLSELEIIEGTYKMFKNYTKVGHSDSAFVASYLVKLLQEYVDNEVKNEKSQDDIDTDSW